MAVALYNCIKREDDGTYGPGLAAALAETGVVEAPLIYQRDIEPNADGVFSTSDQTRLAAAIALIAPGYSGPAVMDVENPYFTTLDDLGSTPAQVDATVALYDQILAFAQNLRPDLRWGCYDIPHPWHVAQPDQAARDARLARQWSVARKQGALFPSMYDPILGDTAGRDSASAIYFLQTSVLPVAEEMSIPVYAFVHPRLAGGSHTTWLSDAEVLRHARALLMARTAAGRRIDGFVLWDFKPSAYGEPVEVDKLQAAWVRLMAEWAPKLEDWVRAQRNPPRRASRLEPDRRPVRVVNTANSDFVDNPYGLTPAWRQQGVPWLISQMNNAYARGLRVIGIHLPAGRNQVANQAYPMAQWSLLDTAGIFLSPGYARLTDELTEKVRAWLVAHPDATLMVYVGSWIKPGPPYDRDTTDPSAHAPNMSDHDDVRIVRDHLDGFLHISPPGERDRRVGFWFDSSSKVGTRERMVHLFRWLKRRRSVGGFEACPHDDGPDGDMPNPDYVERHIVLMLADFEEKLTGHARAERATWAHDPARTQVLVMMRQDADFTDESGRARLTGFHDRGYVLGTYVTRWENEITEIASGDDATLMDFATDGSFSRPSVATKMDGPSKISHVGVDVIRVEDRRDGKGPLVLLEGTRTNWIRGSDEVGNVSGSWSNDAQVTPNDAVAPDGQWTADRLAADGVAPDRTRAMTGRPNDDRIVASVYCALGTQGAFASLRAAASANGEALITATREWRRYVSTYNNPGAPAAVQPILMCHQNGHASAGVAGDNFLWAHGQCETGVLFASSYIPTALSVPARRAADVLTFAGPDIDMRSKRWRFGFAPDFSDAQMDSDVTLLSWGLGDEVRLTAAKRLEVWIDGALKAQTPVIGWTAGGLLAITFSPAEGILGVGGGLSVDAVAVIGAAWAFPSGAFRLGGRLGGAMEAFGRYKNPRRSWFPTGPIA
jgi:hypothetical protein